MVHLLEAARGLFDVMLFDSAPILGASDASILSTLVDSSIIVVRHRHFPRSVLRRAKKAIKDYGARVLGVVLSKVDLRYDQSYQYYTSYRSYYTKQKNGEKPSATRARAKSRISDNEDEY
jgi:Mrp family chromosome partitioning ATPase